MSFTIACWYCWRLRPKVCRSPNLSQVSFSANISQQKTENALPLFIYFNFTLSYLFSALSSSRSRTSKLFWQAATTGKKSQFIAEKTLPFLPFILCFASWNTQLRVWLFSFQYNLLLHAFCLACMSTVWLNSYSQALTVFVVFSTNICLWNYGCRIINSAKPTLCLYGY